MDKVAEIIADELAIRNMPPAFVRVLVGMISGRAKGLTALLGGMRAKT